MRFFLEEECDRSLDFTSHPLKELNPGQFFPLLLVEVRSRNNNYPVNKVTQVGKFSDNAYTQG